MFNLIINSIRKSSRLKKISQDLNCSMGSVEEVLQGSEKRDKALKELYSMCIKDKYINSTMNKYNITFDKYVKIYNQLLEAGAGQWAKGHFVPVSSLAFNATLKFILENKNKLNISDISYSLIEYFENNKTGKVKITK